MKVWARPAYLTVGSSEGTEEEQEPLDRSFASSCSLGPAVAKTLFDVIHLRGLALIMSASGTPWPPPTLHTDDSDKWSYKRTPHPLRPHSYLLWNHTGTENSQSHIPLHIKVDKGMKGFVYKQFKYRITTNCSLARKESYRMHVIQSFKQTGCTAVSKDHSDLRWP